MQCMKCIQFSDEASRKKSAPFLTYRQYTQHQLVKENKRERKSAPNAYERASASSNDEQYSAHNLKWVFGSCGMKFLCFGPVIRSVCARFYWHTREAIG